MIWLLIMNYNYASGTMDFKRILNLKKREKFSKKKSFLLLLFNVA